MENRVGAGGNIGADAVAKATDNHTIGLMINGNMTVSYNHLTLPTILRV